MGSVVFAVKVTKKALFERKVIFPDIIPYKKQLYPSANLSEQN
jgi:hypothetical protein